MEFRTNNPCDRLGPVLGSQDAVVRHMRALPHREAASALETVRASEGMSVVKLAFEFPVLTAARWGEVRGAEWAEIDRREGVWSVPATRMKTKREHRVPLCRRAVEILDEARALDDGSPLAFTDGAGSSTARDGGSRSTGSRPCRTAFAPASGTGRPRKRIVRAK